MLVLYAALAMVVQDVLAVLLVQAEARNRDHLSGLLDAVGWNAGIITTTISVTTLQGHQVSEKVLVVAAMSVANYVGSVTGVRIGKRYVHERPEPAANV